MLSALMALLRRAVRRRRIDDDLREEVEHHLELRRDALIAEGLSAEEAHAAARRAFGNVTRVREQSRDAWAFARLESLVQDARYGARLLMRAPFFTLVTVVSVGFSVAAALAIATIVNAMVYRPLGVAPAARIYRIYTGDQQGGLYGNTSLADYRDFANAVNVFGATCAIRHVRANVTVGDRPEVQSGALLTPQCFQLLGVTPHLGRMFGPSAAAASPEVVVSYPLWRRRFAESAGAVGQRVLINGISATIVGVAARGFNGTSLDGSAEFWVPLDGFPMLLPSRAPDDRRFRAFVTLAQLHDGVTAAQAESALAGIAASLRQVDPRAWSDAAGGVRKVTVMDETRSRFAGAPGALPAMLAGAGAAVIGVLALACVNVAVLLLARGASRTRELTIRLALGASRGRVLRQLAVESLLIAALGTLIAGAMISIALRVAAARYPEGVPAVNLAIDWRVASFAVIAAALASLLFGLAPGAHAIKLAIADGLKGRAAAIRRGWFVLGARELLIVLQVAASVALVLAAGLVADAFVRGSAASPGFQTAGVTTVSVDLATDDQARMLRLSDALLDRAQRTRGVASVAIAGMLPLIGSSITVEARPEAGEARVLEANVVSSGYFATLRIPVKAGRDFSAVDRRGSRDVAIASETLARTVWQTPNVIGRTLTIDRRIVEIIGVVADTRYRAIAEPFRPVVYLPVSQWPAPHFVVHARGAADGATAAALERALRSIDPTILVDTALPLTARLDSLRGAERFAQAGAGAAGIAQLALVLMALWALVAYAVERRRVEIGIRMALGATAGGILRLMLRPAVLLILVGSVAGTALGIVTASVLQANFVGLDELQPIAGLPIVALLVIVATAAALVPARRAARVDPMHALRAE